MHHLIQPVYFPVPLSEEWQQETVVQETGIDLNQMIMNGQRGAGGGSNKGWKIVSDREKKSSEENQSQAITNSESKSGWMPEEDEFRLGDGETGDGNILRKPMATDEGEQTDDV